MIFMRANSYGTLISNKKSMRIIYLILIKFLSFSFNSERCDLPKLILYVVKTNSLSQIYLTQRLLLTIIEYQTLSHIPPNVHIKMIQKVSFTEKNCFYKQCSQYEWLRLQ